jgi:hypothetical protein
MNIKTRVSINEQNICDGIGFCYLCDVNLKKCITVHYLYVHGEMIMIERLEEEIIIYAGISTTCYTPTTTRYPSPTS